MQASQTQPLNGRCSTSPGRTDGNIERAQLRQTSRRQAIVIDALARTVSTLLDSATALRAENAALRAIVAPNAAERALPNARRGGRLRATQGDADQARRATVQAVRSASSGPQRLPHRIQPVQDYERTAVAQHARRPARGQ
jgi:hypothetical protein